MNKFEKFLIDAFAFLFVLTLTALACGASIWSIKWILNLLGVL